MAGRAKRASARAPEAIAGPWNLPDGWYWERLGDVVSRRTEKVIPQETSRMTFVGLEHIAPGAMQLSGTGPLSEMKSAASLFQAGDVLYARLRPYLNKVWVANADGACSGEFFVLTPGQNVLSEYLGYYLHSQHFVYFASHAVTGDRPRIDFEEIANFTIPTPPIEVQRHLVERVHDLLCEIDDGERALAEAREGLNTYRASLLNAAVTGKLTAGWRQETKCISTRAEHIRVILEGGGARSKSWAGDMPTLPDGWAWVPLARLITDGPANGYSPRASKDGTGTKSLKLTATSSGRLELHPDCIKTLSETIAPGSNLYLEPGDLLFQRGNTRELVGMAAVYDGPPETFIYPDLMIRIRTAYSSLTRWIWRYALSPRGRQYLMSSAKGAAGSMPKITGQTIREMPIPLAPLEEIEAALSLLEKELDASEVLLRETSLALPLSQSILSSAFRGELV